MKYCCKDCFVDYAIKKFISNNLGKSGRCEYCRNNNKNLVSLKIISKFILEGILREYVDVNQTEYDELNPWLFPKIYSIEEIFDNISIFSNSCREKNNLIQDIVYALEPPWWEVKNGAVNPYSDRYIRRDDFYNNWINKNEQPKILTWESFKDDIKYSSRYLSSNLDKIACLNEILQLLKLSVFELPANTELWRARKVGNQINPKTRKLMSKNIGPPPHEKTVHSRMSPAGISYFYASGDMRTCLLEAGIKSNDKMWIGCFNTRKKIHILDLTGPCKFNLPSIFDSSYRHNQIYADKFLDEFTKEISAPIDSNKDAISYVPTQAFAEFIRDKKLCGIKYRSSLNNSGINYVFFLNRNESYFPLGNQEYDSDPFEVIFWLRRFISSRVNISGKLINLQEKQFKKYYNKKLNSNF